MNVESYWLQNIFVSYPFDIIEMINWPEEQFFEKRIKEEFGDKEIPLLK
jgi:hypothetical protein